MSDSGTTSGSSFGSGTTAAVVKASAAKAGSACCYPYFHRSKLNRSGYSTNGAQRYHYQIGNFGFPGYGPSKLVNENVYLSSRLTSVDEDEKLNWSADAVHILKTEHPNIDIGITFQTAIRRGVPDYLKRHVFIKAHMTDTFIARSPQFYQKNLKHTFGDRIPDDFDSQLPTFAGGFLGLEEQISGRPLNVERLEEPFGIARSEVSWADLGHHTRQEPPLIPYGESAEGFLSKFKKVRHSIPSMRDDMHSIVMPSIPDSPFVSRMGDAPWRQSTRSLIDSLDSDLPYYEPYEKDRCGLPIVSDPSRQICSPQSSPASRSGRYDSSPMNSPQLRSLRSKSFHSPSRPSLFRPHSSFSARRRVAELDTLPGETVSDFSEYRMHFDDSDETGALLSGSSYSSPSKVAAEATRSSTGTEKTGKRDVYKLESVTHLHKLLTENGVVAAKRILWCLSASYEDIEFCPVLPNLICVCLLYLAEDETFSLVTRILDKAREDSKAGTGKLFLVYRRTQYVRFVKLVVAAANKHLSRVMTRLQLLGFDSAAWFAKAAADGLARSVPFNLLVRIYSTFLFEGAKVFQRYSLALVRVNEEKLLNCKSVSDVELALLKSNYSSPEELNHITKTAFGFSFKDTHESITHYSSYDLPTPFLTNVKVQRFYRPRLKESSVIIKDAEWEFLWSWLSHKVRICDPSLTWRSYKDGATLLALNRKVEPHHLCPMVFIIATTAGEVIGGYSSKSFTMNKANMSEVDPSDSFIFQLRPQQCVFGWAGTNKSFISFDNSFILVGLDDFAISIDNAVHRGRCATCASFNSPKLAGDKHGEFVVRRMEVWTLHY